MHCLVSGCNSLIRTDKFDADSIPSKMAFVSAVNVLWTALPIVTTLFT